MLYTVKEAAEILKTNVHYVYTLIQKGLLPAMKIGSWKIRKEALDTFLAQYEGYDISDPCNIVRAQKLVYDEGNSPHSPHHDALN